MAKRKLDEWKKDETEGQESKMLQQIIDEDARKKKEKDAENIGYVVLLNGKVEFESKHYQEARNVARGINAKVFWTIEGAIVNEVLDKL